MDTPSSRSSVPCSSRKEERPCAARPIGSPRWDRPVLDTGAFRRTLVSVVSLLRRRAMRGRIGRDRTSARDDLPDQSGLARSPDTAETDSAGYLQAWPSVSERKPRIGDPAPNQAVPVSDQIPFDLGRSFRQPAGPDDMNTSRSFAKPRCFVDVRATSSSQARPVSVVPYRDSAAASAGECTAQSWYRTTARTLISMFHVKPRSAVEPTLVPTDGLKAGTATGVLQRPRALRGAPPLHMPERSPPAVWPQYR